MTVTAATHLELNRTYVQSKVIEANLHHVTDILSSVVGDLGDDLRSFTERFGQFVVRLCDASNVAAAREATQ